MEGCHTGIPVALQIAQTRVWHPKVVPFGDYLIGLFINHKKELLRGPMATLQKKTQEWHCRAWSSPYTVGSYMSAFGGRG